MGPFTFGVAAKTPPGNAAAAAASIEPPPVIFTKSRRLRRFPAMVSLLVGSGLLQRKYLGRKACRKARKFARRNGGTAPSGSAGRGGAGRELADETSPARRLRHRPQEDLLDLLEVQAHRGLGGAGVAARQGPGAA